jgi:alpha-1,2-mannosyltransferase
VAGAAWMAVRGKHIAAGALLGAGALVKLYPAALLLVLPLAGWPAAVPAFVGVAVAGYAPAVLGGAAVLGSLPRYLVEEYFNIGVLRSIVPSPAVSLAAAALWTVGVATIGRNRPFPARAVSLIGGLVLLSPNIFPWYAVWLVPFLAWSPRVPWIVFTGTVAFAYAFFMREPWAIPAWARVLEFAPLALGILWWAGRGVVAPVRCERRA